MNRFFFSEKDGIRVTYSYYDISFESIDTGQKFIIDNNGSILYNTFGADSTNYFISYYNNLYNLVNMVRGLNSDCVNINPILDIVGVSKDILDKYSYESGLDCSLSKNMSKVDELIVLEDAYRNIEWLWGKGVDLPNIEYRIKSKHSVKTKILKNKSESKKIKGVLNDILGFRSVCSSYSDILNSNKDGFRVVDMSKGKKNDDGYRGVHVYYQKSSRHYPIEIQFSTLFDRQFNDWMHIYSYKYLDNNVGRELRKQYEDGKIKTERDFLEVLNYVLYSSKKI